VNFHPTTPHDNLEQKGDATLAVLAGRRPNLALAATFGLVAGIVHLVGAAITDGLTIRLFTECLAVWAVIDTLTVGTLIGGIAVARKRYSTHPGPLASAASRSRWSYGSYAVVGLLTAAVRINSMLIVPMDEAPPESWHPILAITLSTTVAVLTIGVVANVFGNLNERSIRSEAALGVRVEQLEGTLDELDRCRQGLIGVDEGLRKDTSDWMNSRLQARLLTAEVQLGMAAALMDKDPDAAQLEISRLRSELADVRNGELREAANRLHPAIVSIGLVPAITKLVNEFSDVTEVDLVVSPDVELLDDLGAGQIPEAVRLSVYRLVEESARNAINHGQAKHVHVTLDVAGTDLLVTVTDDGCGFALTETEKGLGIHSMEARVRSFGGTLSLTSRIGSGTEVLATFPTESTVVDLRNSASSLKA